jgi:hypothetical protein
MDHSNAKSCLPMVAVIAFCFFADIYFYETFTLEEHASIFVESLNATFPHKYLQSEYIQLPKYEYSRERVYESVKFLDTQEPNSWIYELWKNTFDHVMKGTEHVWIRILFAWCRIPLFVIMRGIDMLNCYLSLVDAFIECVKDKNIMFWIYMFAVLSAIEWIFERIR